MLIQIEHGPVAGQVVGIAIERIEQRSARFLAHGRQFRLFLGGTGEAGLLGRIADEQRLAAAAESCRVLTGLRQLWHQ
jgi:hypothetical protein